MSFISLILYLIFAVAGFLKGSAAILNAGGYWKIMQTGVFPSSSSEIISATLIQCGTMCSLNAVCKGFFYEDDTTFCHFQYPIPVGQPTLHSSPSARYYGRDVEGFRTFVLPVNDVFTIRIFPDRNMTQTGAALACKGYGGHLLQVVTSERHDQINILKPDMTGNGPFWIDVTNKNALNYMDINGWTTEEGESLPFTLWASSTQPNDPSNRHCVLMYASDGFKWKTNVCNRLESYVCEI